GQLATGVRKTAPDRFGQPVSAQRTAAVDRRRLATETDAAAKQLLGSRLNARNPQGAGTLAGHEAVGVRFGQQAFLALVVAQRGPREQAVGSDDQHTRD